MSNDFRFLMYQSAEENVSVNAVIKDETIWLSQKGMAELFGCSTDNISLHLKNIFSDGELTKDSVTEKISVTASDGKKYLTQFYNLDAIIAVGYRVNSKKATRFRQWATKTLKEYIMKGFVLNDEMLKNGKPFGKDYFDELLERIKEIRASERRFYQKITDIYAQCSYDYDPKSNITDLFFKTVQNKLLFAVTQHTAPELVADRADSEKEHMGLTTWKNAPNGKVLQSDALVSKNYLTKEELSSLNDIVSMYLDYAENQAKRNRLMSMQDWKNKLDAFLQFNEYDILNHTGKVSREVADQLAITEYKKFRVKQDKTYLSDFDKLSAKYLKSNQKFR